MTRSCTPAAVRATARMIADDGAHAVAPGFDPIPADEVIVEPDPSRYIAPRHIRGTAPHLAAGLGELLGVLRDLNARFAGRRTVEAQATLSLTGEHEWLEERFLDWCWAYSRIRGSLGRLNPRNNNDPWRLYLDCCGEFEEHLERRIMQPGTINSSVLNLSQRFIGSALAAEVLGPDLEGFQATGRDRFASETNRASAGHRYAIYDHQVMAFTRILREIARHLPGRYAPLDGPDWLAGVRAEVARRAEDLTFLRDVLCALNVDATQQHQLGPNLWARFEWDVHHGGSVAAVCTTAASGPLTADALRHVLAIRRDGWLCHREYPWVRVQPDHPVAERRAEIAVGWYVLDTLTAPLYDAWDRLDRGRVVARGREPDATEDEQGAALAIALAEPEAIAGDGPATKRPGLPRLRLRRLRAILERHFDCEWSMAKGSEQKVHRPGGKVYVFGCHGADRPVSPVQIKDCLKRLGIPCADFIIACG